MKFLAILFLTLALMGKAIASVAPPAHACCAEQDCGFVQCAEMGCLPAVAPFAAGPVPFKMLTIPVARELIETSSSFPSAYKEIWTPPD